MNASLLSTVHDLQSLSFRCRSKLALAVFAELPIVEARVSEAAPVEPPHQDGNAAADAAPRKGRGKKAADSVKAAPRQAQIDTILVKAKRATGAAKSLAGKALSKVAELAGGHALPPRLHHFLCSAHHSQCEAQSRPQNLWLCCQEEMLCKAGCMDRLVV